MDITSNGKYPANKLSNFAGHRFTLDDVEIYSMEGFLQGLKYKSPEMQREVCTLIGRGAKRMGAKKNWKQNQILWWKGKSIARDSEEYTNLIARAFDSMFEQSESFRAALIAAKGATLTHSMGRKKKNETVLTTTEFISNLNRLREKL